MAAEKGEGVVLRLTDFSETSRIVVLFTREFGKISALAKGGRRLKGPFESALDLLSACRIVFLRKSSSGLDLLTEAQLIERFRPQERDLGCLYAGYYVAELLLSLTEEYDPHPELYDAARETLAGFSSAESLPIKVLRFELVLLREIGQLPDFDACAGCGSRLAEGRRFGFWVSQGGLICPDCQRPDYAQIEIHAGTAAILRKLSEETGQAWRRLQAAAQQVKEAQQVTSAALSHILGRRPKTLALLKGASSMRNL
jgi:DNA repair protein RecO (recombination protein O)